MFAQLLPVILHTVILYVFIIFALRVFGGRHTTELSTIDLVLLMVIGSAVETSMVAGDTSLPAGLVSAATLFAADRLYTYLVEHWGWLRDLVVGRPIPLVYNGHFLSRRLREAGMTEDDVMQGLRERGYADLDKIQLAVLELDGVISAVPFKPKSGDQK